MQYKPDTSPMSFLIDYNYSNDSKDEKLANRSDIHFGAEYDIDNSFTLRTGFFSQKDYRNKEIDWFDDVGVYSQIFTAMGISYKRDSFTLNLAAMDSHLFSSGKMKQTYINAGMSYDFRLFEGKKKNHFHPEGEEIYL